MKKILVGWKRCFIDPDGCGGRSVGSGKEKLWMAVFAGIGREPDRCVQQVAVIASSPHAG